MKDIHYPFRHAITLGAVCVALPMTIADAQPVGSTWMIVQTARDPLALVGVAAARRAPGARVLSAADCAEFRPGFYVLGWPGRARPAGKPMAGSYTKHCTPKPGSVAALGLPAVDPSFAAMRDTPINFGGRISSRRSSHDCCCAWYTPAANDPREGLRMAVEDVAGPPTPDRT